MIASYPVTHVVTLDDHEEFSVIVQNSKIARIMTTDVVGKMIVVAARSAQLTEVRDAINATLNDMAEVIADMGQEKVTLDGTVPDLSGLDSSTYVQVDRNQMFSIHGINHQEAQELCWIIGDQTPDDPSQLDPLRLLYHQLVVSLGGSPRKRVTA